MIFNSQFEKQFFPKKLFANKNYFGHSGRLGIVKGMKF